VSEAVVRVVLRATAIAIGVAALIDPAFSSTSARDRAVVGIRLATGSLSAIEAALVEHLNGRELTTRVPVGNRLPCAIDETCVAIADGTVDSNWEAAQPVSLIVTDRNGAPNVRIRSVVLSGGHRSAAGSARVMLSGLDVAGKRTEMRILDGGIVVGSATHDWSAASTVTMEIPWWPLGSGARALRVEAVPLDGEASAIDNGVDAGATVADQRLSILVFDARPSWNSTFVRRALEDDARFTVGYRSRIAPALAAATPGGRLDASALDTVGAVIVGGPEALIAEDVALLERYVRVSGGTLVLLPERTPAGAAADLFPANGVEHLTANPENVGALRAAEILRWSAAPVTATIVARSGNSPAILSVPKGNGRIIVSGAMDAWRYRNLDSGAFDRFWTSLVARGAALGERLQLTFDDEIAARGSRVRFTLRSRTLEAPEIVEASATANCHGETHAIRLWPGGTSGEFTGEVPAVRAGECTVEAIVDGRRTAASIAIVDRPAHGTEVTIAKLERQARLSGGTVATAREMQSVARAIAAAPTSMSHVVSWYPMRAPWWILPFAGCLSIEWWLRRRQGLR
jgi:hypothetical protein